MRLWDKSRSQLVLSAEYFDLSQEIGDTVNTLSDSWFDVRPSRERLLKMTTVVDEMPELFMSDECVPSGAQKTH